MGARVYDPYTGTFTQPDPIQRADASNYGYADGDPVNETDLDGQSVVGDICIRTGNCTDNHGSPEPKNPTLGDIVQVITLVTLPTVLLDPMEGGAEAAAAHAAEDAGGDAGRLVIGRTADLKAPGAIGPGEHTLLDQLPDLGDPKANWQQNSTALRGDLRNGVTEVRDASPGDTAGQYLNAERNLLSNRGFEFDSRTKLWRTP